MCQAQCEVIKRMSHEVPVVTIPLGYTGEKVVTKYYVTGLKEL